MTALEVILIIIGIIFMAGSFFVPEKLSARDLNQISELSTSEIKKIVEKELANAQVKISDKIDESIDGSMDAVERAMEKESNEKIMAINEYSDTVLESIHSTHNEVMFLYSMLNDKHKELTEFSGTLGKLKTELENFSNRIETRIATVTTAMDQPVKTSEPKKVKVVADTVTPKPESAIQMFSSEQQPSKLSLQEAVESISDDEMIDTLDASDEVIDDFNHNERIMRLHNEGKTNVQIAKELGLGLGEVKLVLDLFKGEA